MAKFTLSFKCDNAAFHADDEADVVERDEAMRDGIRHALLEVARVIDEQDSDLELGGTLYDVNGNSIGRWEFNGK